MLTGNETKIILENSGKVWSVPIHKYNKDGTTKYKSRFFTLQEENDITCTKEKKHVESSARGALTYLGTQKKIKNKNPNINKYN